MINAINGTNLFDCFTARQQLSRVMKNRLKFIDSSEKYLAKEEVLITQAGASLLCLLESNFKKALTLAQKLSSFDNSYIGTAHPTWC